MARNATVIGEAVDAWGDTWDVRERRKTPHGFDVQIGWPKGVPRGRGGSGGPKVIVTPALAAYLETLRGARSPIVLPVGATTIKRLRRLLGMNGYIDRARWWESRSHDLADLTIAEFAERHKVSTGAVSQARTALFGPSLRPKGWWREPDVAMLLLAADRPASDIADDLGISAGSVRRLRHQLVSGGAFVVPSFVSVIQDVRSRGRRLTSDEISRADELLREGMSGEAVAKLLGVSASAINRRRRLGQMSHAGANRRRTLPDSVAAEIDRLLMAGMPPLRICELTGVSDATIYRRRKAIGISEHADSVPHPIRAQGPRKK